MDKYQAFKIFARVSEKLSFSKAAEEMNMPKATVSTTIQDLEANLGVRLLNRTTRQVTLTAEGLNFLEKCKEMLNEVDEAESMFRTQASQIKGKIRIDMGVTMAKDVIIPRLPEFLKKYPDIEIELSTTDHYVDLAREGIDCVLRGGSRTEPDLIEKDLGSFTFVNCVSPAYIKNFGKPKNLEDLKNHRLIHYTQSFGGRVQGFEYFDGEKYRELKMRSSITLKNTDSYKEVCIAGLGIGQLSRAGVRQHLKDGSLIEILPKLKSEPVKIKLVYHQRRLLTSRVRVFMEWIESVVHDYLNV